MTRHIAVVGGGYAGIMALGRLRMQDPEARLTLIDPGTHFEARIHLHQVAAGGAAPHVPYAEICAQWRAAHLQEKLHRIDGRRLTTAMGTVEPDAVILALGSRTRAAPGPAHTLDDDASARQLAAALEAHEEAAVTVVGAGTTALEAVTALAVAHPRARLTLWRSAPWPEHSATAFSRRLADLGVEDVEGGRVVGIDRHRVWSATDERPHDEVVWCGGFQPSLVPGLTAGPDGRVVVDPFLHLGEGVFAAGDLSCPPEAHRMGCVSALPTGAHAAANTQRWLHGLDLEPFRFRDLLTCIDLGAGRGVVQLLDGTGSVTRVVDGRAGGISKAGILLWVRAILHLERRTGWPLYRWVASPRSPLAPEPA